MSPFVLLLDWEGFEKDKYVHTVLEDNLLPHYLEKCSWFKPLAQKSWRVKVTNAVRMKYKESEFFFLQLQIKYSNSFVESYIFPISFVAQSMDEIPESAYISRASLDDLEGFLVDGVYDPNFRNALFYNMCNDVACEQKNGCILSFERGHGLKDEETLESSFIDINGDNTAFVYNQKYFFKLYRRFHEGINPEIEALRYLSKSDKFNNYPEYCGSINVTLNEVTQTTFGVLLEYIPNAEDNYTLTGEYLNDFILGLVDGNFQVKENVFVKVAQLGKKTALMHDALFNLGSEETFRPAQISRTYRRKIHSDLEDALDKSYDMLIEEYLNLDEATKKLAWVFMESKDKILNFIDQVLTRTFNSLRIRIHGDFHLAQILMNEKGIHVIDFEGDHSLPIVERNIKHSPIKDVASMIRSYHYAVSEKLYSSELTRQIPEVDLLRASDRWYRLMKDTFVDQYLNYFGPHHTLLKNNNEVNYLLQFHLLEKAISELRYEIVHRPTWVKIPLKGILDIIKEIEKLRTQ